MIIIIREYLIFRSVPMNSQEINLDQPKELQQQIYQSLEPELEQEQLDKNLTSNQPVVISIKLHDCQVVISKEQASLEYQVQEQWDQLLSKIYVERSESMNLKLLNSIIGLSVKNQQIRKKVWKKIVQQRKIQDQNQGLEEPNEKIMKQIECNIEKFSKKQIFKQEIQSNTNQQRKSMMRNMIIMYEGKQPNLGTLKGLQYIIYGLYLASPFKEEHEITHNFLYFMEVLGINRIFYHGSPMFYVELGLIQQQLKIEAPLLYKYLEQNNVDWAKIFTAYYKSLMINKITNRNLISKLFDLILICISFFFIFRWNLHPQNDSQLQLLQYNDPEELMKVMGTNLILIYFQQPLSTKMKQKQPQPLQRQKKHIQRQQFMDDRQFQKEKKLEFDESEQTIKILRKLIMKI